ncbi:hypothetical protein SCOR_27365 [Sulfidibacter corallicola]
MKLDDPKNNTYYYFPIDGRLESLLQRLLAFRREYARVYLKLGAFEESEDDFLLFGKHPSIALGDKTIRRQFGQLSQKL